MIPTFFNFPKSSIISLFQQHRNPIQFKGISLANKSYLKMMCYNVIVAECDRYHILLGSDLGYLTHF